MNMVSMATIKLILKPYDSCGPTLELKVSNIMLILWLICKNAIGAGQISELMMVQQKTNIYLLEPFKRKELFLEERYTVVGSPIGANLFKAKT